MDFGIAEMNTLPLMEKTTTLTGEWVSISVVYNQLTVEENPDLLIGPGNRKSVLNTGFKSNVTTRRYLRIVPCQKYPCILIGSEVEAVGIEMTPIGLRYGGIEDDSELGYILLCIERPGRYVQVYPQLTLKRTPEEQV